MTFNLSGKTTASYLFVLIGMVSVATAQGADQKWWHTSSPNAAVNGQITLKNGTGATRTINNNPTSATLATRTANTQPPTVIVQATATLPVVAEGSACNNAVDTAAVNSDKTLILTCQSGIYKSVGSGIKGYREFDWYNGYGTFGTGLPYLTWYCALNHVGGKWAGGGENIQVYRDGGSGTWIVSGSSGSDNSGAFASISCVQLG